MTGNLFSYRSSACIGQSHSTQWRCVEFLLSLSRVLTSFQGGKVIINSFYVEDFGKLYRSVRGPGTISALIVLRTIQCGNCKSQTQRSVEINDVIAKSGKLLVGINS